MFHSDAYNLSIYQFKRNLDIDSIYDLLVDRDVDLTSSVAINIKLCQASLPTIFKQTRPLPP